MKQNAPQILVRLILTAAPAFLITARAPQQDKPEPPKIIHSGGVLDPSPVKRADPEYPPLAKTARVSGSVVVEVTVDEDGKVIGARALSGHPLLKDAAVEAAREWTFTPMTISGSPSKVVSTLTFNFTLPKASKELDEEIAADPTNPILYFELGQAYEDFDNQKTLDAYRKAIAFNPDYGDARYALVYTLAKMRRDDEAIGAYKQAIGLEAATGIKAKAGMVAGFILYQAQRLQEALEIYAQVATLPKKSYRREYFDSHFYLGEIYLKLGDRTSAWKEYEFLLNNDPNLAKSLLNEF